MSSILGHTVEIVPASPPRDSTSPDTPSSRQQQSSMISTLLYNAPGSGVISKATAYIDEYVTQPLSAAVPSKLRLSTTTTSSRKSKGSESPPYQVSIRLSKPGSEDVYVSVTPETSIEQLRLGCQKASGVDPHYQQLVIEEERPSSSSPSDGTSSLLSALRHTASQFTSRQKASDSIKEWVNFLFVPEALNREMRGRGIAVWFKEHILPHLQGPQPPHIAQITVVMYNDRRFFLQVNASTSLLRVKQAVEKSCGIPLDRQRFLIVQNGPATSYSSYIFWTLARLFYIVISTLMSLTTCWARWLLLGPDAEHYKKKTIKLNVTTDQGVTVKEINLDVRQDMTIAQLQQEVQLHHGDNVSIHGLTVLSTGSGSDTSKDATTSESFKLHHS